MPTVRLRVLGPFALTVDGVERRIAARKQRVLLATLATRRHPVVRDELIALLWPESDTERGRQSLRHALYGVQESAGVPLIDAGRDQVRLRADVTVDLREFEEAVAQGTEAGQRTALALYAADLTLELEGPEAEAERVRLRGSCSAAGAALGAVRLAADPTDAIAIARRLIEIDPYREEAHRLLLRALSAAGDLAAAAVHYRRLTTLLREELGVDPSAETRDLYATLSAGGGVAARPVRRPPLEPPRELIGRRDEYGRLMRVVTDAIDGQGGTALISGEPGSGKSRMLDEIGAVAERHGLRVLPARATAAEGDLPFQVWVDALSGVRSDASTLPHPWPAVLAPLFGEVARTDAGTVGPDLGRTRLFEGVKRLLAQVSDRVPVLLILDDLHHADPDSIQLVHSVARASRRRRIAVLGAARPVHPSHPLHALQGSLAANGPLAAVTLGPLAGPAVRDLLERFGVAAPTAAWLAPRVERWTAGNPFFALELVRALIDLGRLGSGPEGWLWVGERPGPEEALAPALPPTVRQTILARVGSLPEATRRVVDLLAVLGATAELDLVAAVAERDELALAEELVPAIDLGMVRESRDRGAVVIAFVHELVRDATYHRLPLSVRAAIHRRAAAALERVGAPHRTVALHLSAGGDAPRAVEHWLASAREAEARSAHDDAIRGYQGALGALGPTAEARAEIFVAIGDAHLRRGAARAGATAYREALEILPAGAAARRAAVATRIAATASSFHRAPDALAQAEVAIAYYRGHGPRDALADALVALGWVRYLDADAQGAHAAADEGRAIAREAGAPRTEARAIHVSIFGRWLAGDIVATPDADDLVRLADALGDDEAMSDLWRLRAVALGRLGRPAEAVEHARRALEVARRVGSLRAQLQAGEDLVEALRATGAFADSLAVAEAVLADVSELELGAPPRLLGELAVGHALAGDPARAADLAGKLVAPERASDAPVHGSPALSGANALLLLGRSPADGIVASQRPSCRTCLLTWTAIAGRDAALRGDVAATLSFAAALEALRAERGAPVHGGLVEHLRALAAARAGRTDEARAAADAALTAYAAIGRRDAHLILERDLEHIGQRTP